MWIPKTELQSPDLTAGAFTEWRNLSAPPSFCRLLPMVDPAQGASLSLGSCCPIKRIPSLIQAVAVQCLIKSGIPDFLCVGVSACLCPGLLLRRLFLHLYPCQIPSLNKAGFSRIYIVTLCIAQASHFLPRKTQVALSYVFVIALKLQCNLVKHRPIIPPPWTN